jgi:riboflavin synthase
MSTGSPKIVARKDVNGMADFRLRAPKALCRFIAAKGSVALDGTSLTVNEVNGDEFSVFLIPHTLKVTHWKDAKAGDAVNLEVDQMARYAARLAERA